MFGSGWLVIVFLAALVGGLLCLFGVLHAKDAPAADCSTGEQKALLIGLILAHRFRNCPP